MLRIALWIESYLLLEGFQQFINNEPDMEITWNLRDAQESLLLKATGVDVVITDLKETLGNIRKILITGQKIVSQKDLLTYGIHGVIPVNAEPGLIGVAIRSVAVKNTFIHPNVRVIGNGHSDLTPREVQVLQRLASGMRVKEIAPELELSVKTIEAHKHNLMKKLGIHDKLELLTFAIKHGFIENPAD